MTISLIDGDLVAFRCAASCKPEEPLEIAVFRADKLLREILEQTQSSEYVMYLRGEGNFRKDINKYYKANRNDQEPPKWLEDTRQFLVREWNAKLCQGIETDDMLGISQTDETIICSLDKDLRMIPGRHYSWAIGTSTWSKDAEFVDIDYETANKTFFKQMLIGDKTDNIFGIDKIGPVKSSKLIDHLDTVEEMFEVVAEKYDDPKRFIMNANCLWILREKNKTWDQSLNLVLPDQYKEEQVALNRLIPWIDSTVVM